MSEVKLRSPHYCPDWDLLWIEPQMPEFEACHCYVNWEARAQDLEQKLSIAREALVFYGKKENWIPVHHELSGINPEAPIDGENGVIARQALEETR